MFFAYIRRDDRVGKIKVIIHVNTLERWSQALGNAKNLIADLGDTEYDIILLANGESVHYYTHDFEAADLKSLKILSEQGVQFKACQNSLNGNKLVPEDLHSFVQVVPAGITELIKKQHEGFAYVKP